MKKIHLSKTAKIICISDLALVLAALVLIFALPHPADVSDLKVADSTYSTAELKWSKAAHAKSYRVLRSEDGKNYEYLETTTDTSFKDKKLRTGKTYYYKVISRNGFKSSDPEAAASPEVTPKLEEPSLDVDTSEGEMKLTYSKVAGASGYEIIRDNEVIGESEDTSFVDEEADDGGKHKYEVRAYRYKDEPVYSEVSNKIKAELHVLQNLTVDTMDDNIIITWDKNSHYNDYNVYDGDELLIETDTNSVMIENFELDRVYDLKVQGKNEDESIQSPEVEKRFAVCEEPMDNKGAIEAAVQWGIDIAADDSFTYGAGRRAHRYGCYFCQTNVGPRKNIKGKSLVNGHSYAKTYCCNPFVHACYAHGAGDPVMLKACQSGHGIAMTKKSFTRYGCWEYLGKLSKSELQRGDVLVRPNHVMMYIGDGQIVQASGGGWDAGSIQVTGLNKRKYTFVMRYTGDGDGTMNVVRDVDEKNNVLDEDGKVLRKLGEDEESKDSDKKDSDKSDKDE